MRRGRTLAKTFKKAVRIDLGRGRYVLDVINDKVVTNGIMPTVTTRNTTNGNIYLLEVYEEERIDLHKQDMGKRYRIRKLTERECFRLMGVPEQDIDKIQSAGVPRSQQYKLAGNSIVVPVMEAIFTKMFSAEVSENETLFG